MNLRLVKTVLMYNYILLNVMIHSTSIFKIQPCKILNLKKKSLASTEDYYSLSKDTIYQFFSCVAKFAKMGEICKIFNLRQFFFCGLKSFIQKIIQDMISAYSIICNLKVIIKKEKIAGYTIFMQHLWMLFNKNSPEL